MDRVVKNIQFPSRVRQPDAEYSFRALNCISDATTNIFNYNTGTSSSGLLRLFMESQLVSFVRLTLQCLVHSVT